MSTNNTASSICLLGGDTRQIYAALELSAMTDCRIVVSGETLSTHFGHGGNDKIIYEENPLKAVHSSFAVVLPLPASSIEREASFIDIVSEIKRHDGVVIGGKFSPYMLDIVEDEGLRYFDYFDDESFNVRNAFITAEGAVSLAMNALNRMLRDVRCTILGFGRIGKALGKLLLAVGCRPTVYARKEEVRTLAREMGFFTVDKIDLQGSEVIFNTVPQRIITNDDLLELESGRILIELASSPGGFDPDIAAGCSHVVIDGKGLPGKYAPESAGRAVAESVFSALKAFV